MLIRRLIALLVLQLTSPTWLAANEATEYELKGAYLYNFANYTAWPDAFESTFDLCIYGQDPFGLALDQVKKAQIKGRMVMVHYLDKIFQAAHWHLLYYSDKNKTPLSDILDHIDSKPVLIVTDQTDGLDQGAMINMLVQEEGVDFEVNLPAAERSRLRINSRLLRFADRVIEN